VKYEDKNFWKNLIRLVSLHNLFEIFGPNLIELTLSEICFNFIQTNLIVFTTVNELFAMVTMGHKQQIP
jgi:hypothetical protein